MFARKLVLTSCLAIAASMLAGCASYKNESGLPKWLDDASEANRLGYFMGISLKDSPAPEGFDPSKNTLVSDLTFSTLAHSNALPGISEASALNSGFRSQQTSLTAKRKKIRRPTSTSLPSNSLHMRKHTRPPSPLWEKNW